MAESEVDIIPNKTYNVDNELDMTDIHKKIFKILLILNNLKKSSRCSYNEPGSPLENENANGKVGPLSK